MTGGWNPRYLAYVYAHGESSPGAMLTKDAERWPGGKMAGFVIWLREQWDAWKRETNWHSRPLLDRYPLASDHAAFDSWLSRRFPPVAERIERGARAVCQEFRTQPGGAAGARA